MSDIDRAMRLNQSFWQYDYGSYRANPALAAGSHDTDVLVIGGGYTGLTCAREIRKDNPGKRVLVLEAHEIGFGASGRNGGFNMTLFGMEPEITKFRWGEEKTRQAQDYMQQAVNYVRELIEREGLESDYEHTGMMRVAYTNKQAQRLRKTFDLLTSVTKPDSFQFLGGDEVRQTINCPHIKAAIYEPDTGILNPCKHVRALKQLAEAAGAEIFENSSVIDIACSNGQIIVKTRDATVSTNKLVLATNAWTHNLKAPKGVANVQAPVWTYQVVTEPLTDAQWKSINWSQRMSIEDNRQLIHYMRITRCGRITMGGGAIGVAFDDRKMDRWHDQTVWKNLEQHLKWMFPTLSDIKIYYKWGGCISANIDMTPEIGFVGDQDIIYSTGCIGHGVSLTQLNGRLIADLVLEKDTELSRFWIVNRKALPMPPGNLLRYLGVKAIEGMLKVVDFYEEGDLRKATTR